MISLKKSIALLSCTTSILFGVCYSGEPTYTANAGGSQSEENENINISLVSEAFGHFIGRNLHSPGVDFDLEGIIRGIREGAAGKPAPMTDQEYENAMTKLQERAFETLAKDNLEAANTFMKSNVRNEGVVEIDPGKLQYITLHNGDGKEVHPHSTPLIHYTGKYLDGTVFGASEEVGGPITIPLDQTIPGFSKGLVGMKEGEKRRLFIHPDLGYGTLGNLPPNALLVFDIEIIKADASSDDHVAANDDDDDDDENITIIDEDDGGYEGQGKEGKTKGNGPDQD